MSTKSLHIAISHLKITVKYCIIALTYIFERISSVKKRIFDIIQIGNKEDLPSRFFDIFIVTAIILNILTLFLETFEELSAMFPVLKVIELVTVCIFCVEYAARVWTADFLYPGCSKMKARVRFIFSFDGIVDLLTILPFFYLSGFIAFRMLRVVRIFRLFRINSQYDSFNVITSVLLEKKNQIISSVFIILILLLASSLGMYSAEHEAQPEVFRNAFSGIWWSMSTLLTVGYGDIYPVTVIGRIMAIVIAFLGVGVVAIPTGIISAGFVEQYNENENSDKKLRDISHIGEIIVGMDDDIVGQTVDEIQTEYNVRLYLIIRGELTLVASGSTRIMGGDILVIESERLVKAAPKK